MKVKDLKKLLKNAPDDLEVIIGRLNEDYENYCSEVKNVNIVKLYHTQPLDYTHNYSYYSELDPRLQIHNPRYVCSEKEYLLLYDRDIICFKNLQPNIIN